MAAHHTDSHKMQLMPLCQQPLGSKSPLILSKILHGPSSFENIKESL